MTSLIKNSNCRDFPGGPIVETLPSNAGGASSIPDRGTDIPRASQSKNAHKNRSSVVTNSVKTLKVVDIKNSLKNRNDKIIVKLCDSKHCHSHVLGNICQQTLEEVCLFWPWLGSLEKTVWAVQIWTEWENTGNQRPALHGINHSFWWSSSNAPPNVNQVEAQGSLHSWWTVLCSSFLGSQSILEAIPDVPVHSNGAADPGRSARNVASGEWHSRLGLCVFLLLCWGSVRWAVGFWSKMYVCFSRLSDFCQPGPLLPLPPNTPSLHTQ